jgi:Sulfotransferase family
MRTSRAIRFQLRAARGLVRKPESTRHRLGLLDGRLVFVVGCPRSGTTFMGRALGSLPGFLELGELAPYKAAIPELAEEPVERAAARVRRTLNTTRRLALTGRLRCVEHTPETAFILDRVALAFPRARFVHMVRDGRDVVSSLLEQGWLNADRSGTDAYDFRYGPETRFWVEPERASEFPSVADARRAAWAWRRYLSAVRESSAPVLELRYEQLVADPAAAASRLAGFLDAPEDPLARELGRARADSIGRYKRDLSGEQLQHVLDESGALLAKLGY